MPRSPIVLTQRKIKIIFGLALAGIFYLQFVLNGENEVVLNQGAPVVLAAERVEVDPFEKLIRHDPLAAIIEARARHLREVEDYKCNLVKQELLPSGMSEEQEIAVKFRHQPYSVMMDWVRNPGLAQRAIYVKDKWVNPNAAPEDRDLAVAQPGPLAQLFLKSIKQPIHGMLSKRSSRRSMDEFGFARSMDMLINYCQIAKNKNELTLEFKGESHFDGRPVWVIHRTLPYSGPNGVYPDRAAEIYIDKEHHVPVAVYCYSDDAKGPANLICKYEFRNIRFNTELTDKDFEPATYGM